MSGVEVIQVVAAVSELVRLSFLFCQFLRRLRRADRNAYESLKRIKQLHEVAYGVKLALERRAEQDGRGSAPRGEEKIRKYITTSVRRCKCIVSDIRKVYTPFNVELQPSLMERAIRAIRLEAIQRDALEGHYAALATQLQALQLNSQTLNTFIAIGTTDRVDESKEEILEAIARLEQYHSKCSSQLHNLVQHRENVPAITPRRATIPAIGITGPDPVENTLDIDVGDDEDDISVMQGTLTAAWELISSHEPSMQSLIDYAPPLDDDADSGLGLEDLDIEDIEIPEQYGLTAMARLRRASAPQSPSQQVRHVHGTSRRFLDGCIIKFQHRVDHAIRKDQNHTAETDLLQLMAYAQERKDKYDINYDKTQMQEQLAEIYKRQGKHLEVFAVLKQLLPPADSTDEHSIEHSRHYQLIAETYYQLWTTQDRKQDLLESQSYALTAFTIREELDAEEELLRQSAHLLANIYEALNAPVEAEVFRDMFVPLEPIPVTPELRQSTERDASILSEPTSGEKSLGENVDVNKELVRAIKDHNIAKVRRLLQGEEVDIDYRTKQYQTPLHIAFERSMGNESMPLALLEHGYVIDADDEEGRTVLHQAAARADARMIRLAIRRDAIKDAKDKSWLTPLLIAVKEGPKQRECRPVIEAIETLLEEGCDPKARDQEGWTILHHAAHNSASSNSSHRGGTIANAILELLLSHLQRAALEAKDKNGYTPFLRIAGAGNAETVAMLLDAGADIHARTNAGRSALYLAIREKPDDPKWANVIKVLVDRKAVVQEDEYPEKDYRRFRYLLSKSDAASTRRMSASARRQSDSRTSINHMERTSTFGSSHRSDSIPEDESMIEGKKTRKGSGLRGFFK